MTNIPRLPEGSLSDGFIAPAFIPADRNEYYLRNEQSGPRLWRSLRSYEIDRLVKNNNVAESWDTVLVANGFDPDRIKNCEFSGMVRIGASRLPVLEHQHLRLHTGITNSRIINCDIGDDAAIHDVRYLAHYIVGIRCLLFDIGEMRTTPCAKFGNGFICEGEAEEARHTLALMNETGGRSVLPFDTMLPADALLFATRRDDALLQQQLTAITQHAFNARPGFYGVVGEESAIKHTRMIIDVKFGDHCRVSGAESIVNATINSSADEPTRIGEGVSIENGIMGRGCAALRAARAVDFIIGNNSRLDHGVRFVNTFLGENSTIAGGEVQHNLIFAAHEQHHSSSFLIASLVMGQSNCAAGDIIGSNHNSRSVDGEIRAGRGFWPGLSVSLKHSSRFASFVLLSKGDYPAELDIRLPFSLVRNNATKDQLEVMPAYWWRHNMYALIRNSWKFGFRDKRRVKTQHIEFDFLAPDTIEEIFIARRFLERATAEAAMRDREGAEEKPSDDELCDMGRDLLTNQLCRARNLEIYGESMEKSNRPTIIINTLQGFAAYGDMLLYYAVKTLIDCLAQYPEFTFSSLANHLAGPRQTRWTNLGGQLIPSPDLDILRQEIKDGKITSWKEIHNRYDLLWEQYPLEKQRHAFATLCELLGTQNPTVEQWKKALEKAKELQLFICDEVFRTRKKDDDNSFRQATYERAAEMEAVITKAEENAFVVQVREETVKFQKTIAELISRG